MRDIFFLSSGTLWAPAAMMDVPSSSLGDRLRDVGRSFHMSNTVAVVVRDSGEVLLVDVGWSAAACADPNGVMGLWRKITVGFQAKAGDAIVDQLRAMKIDPARVTTIVATHFHFDHIGGVCDFPNAELVCGDRELAAFRKFPRHPGYRPGDLVEGGRLRPVSLDGAPTYGFPSSHDLFGDGEIVLLDAKGHTAGNVAVALRGRHACYVHIGDAAYQSWEFGLAPKGPSMIAKMTNWNRKEMERTYENIRACQADPRRPTVVPSHDPVVFARLPHAPTAKAHVNGAPTPRPS